MAKGRVFIVCEPMRKGRDGERHRTDLTPATEWGTPVVLLDYDQSGLNSAPTIATLDEKLADFCDDDYLVPIGDPVLMCAAASVAAFRNDGRVKLLKWDRNLSRYYPIQLVI